MFSSAQWMVPLCHKIKILAAVDRRDMRFETRGHTLEFKSRKRHYLRHCTRHGVMKKKNLQTFAPDGVPICCRWNGLKACENICFRARKKIVLNLPRRRIWWDDHVTINSCYRKKKHCAKYNSNMLSNLCSSRVVTQAYVRFPERNSCINRNDWKSVCDDFFHQRKAYGYDCTFVGIYHQSQTHFLSHIKGRLH